MSCRPVLLSACGAASPGLGSEAAAAAAAAFPAFAAGVCGRGAGRAGGSAVPRAALTAGDSAWSLKPLQPVFHELPSLSPCRCAALFDLLYPLAIRRCHPLPIHCFSCLSPASDISTMMQRLLQHTTTTRLDIGMRRVREGRGSPSPARLEPQPLHLQPDQGLPLLQRQLPRPASSQKGRSDIYNSNHQASPQEPQPAPPGARASARSMQRLTSLLTPLPARASSHR